MTTQPAPPSTAPAGRRPSLGLWLLLGACALGALLALLTTVQPILLLLLTGAAAAALAALIYMVQPRAWVSVLLVLTVATVPLSIYEVPLVAGQTLQLMRIILLAGMGAWVLSMPTVRARLPWSAVALGALTLYSALGFVRTDNFAQALSWLVALAFGCLYAVWFPQVITDRRHVRLLLAGVLGAGAIILIFAVYQYTAWFTGIGMRGYSFIIPGASLFGLSTDVEQAMRYGSLFRPVLPFGTSSHTSPCVAALLLITLPLQFQPGMRAWLRPLLLVYHLALLGVLIATLSRGAWIGLFAGLLVVARYDRHILLSKRAWGALAALFAVGLLLLFTVPDLTENVLGRLNPQQTAYSDEGHWEFLMMAVDMVVDAPLMGVGLGNYKAITGVEHAHNVYAMAAAELGVVGLLLVLLWAGANVWYGACAVRLSAPRTLLRAASVGFLAAIVSILVNNLFQLSFYGGFVWMVSAAVGALYYVARSDYYARHGRGVQRVGAAVALDSREGSADGIA